MNKILSALLTAFLTAISVSADENQETPSVPETLPPSGLLEFSRWSGKLNVPDPVAIAFDNHGRAYVTQTQRRKVQDLDIRQHRDWIPNDVGLQTVEEKRAFFHSALAIGNDDQNKKHVNDFNKDGHHDYRDLMVISENIYRLDDSNSDGIADSIELFADGFRTEVTGIAAGVLAHNGNIYATIAPDVWRIDEVNADQREVVATGFGLHIAYGGHDMHGLTVGPDGKIYWSVGDKGISVTSKEGRKFHYPNQGGVLRCNPDGSGFEVYAHGLRNVQELAFDQFGNLFGVDNDADNAGERERFVHIVKGMDAGWRCNYQYRGEDFNPWMDQRICVPWHAGQPAYIVPPISHSIDGPAGFAFNPGTALSQEYHNYFFLTGAPGGKQIAFQLQRHDDSFRMINEHSIGDGLPIVGINFGPDGGLYGVDWGGGYPLNQKGAVWKIDVPDAATSPIRQQVKDLLARKFDGESSSFVVELLSHADQRVRLKAQFELVSRVGAGTIKLRLLINASRPDQPQLARIHAVWTLGQIARAGDTDAVETLTNLLADEDAQIVVQSLRTIADLPNYDGRKLLQSLQHPDSQVRFLALSAFGEHPAVDAVPTLIQLADTIKLQQTYLRFGLARALSACATAEQLRGLNNADSGEVIQLAAVVALRMKGDPAVADFLASANPHVATEAARAIHDDFSIVAALPDLAKALEICADKPDALVRRSINANFRLGRTEDANRVADFAATNASAEMRLVALNALQDWVTPSVLDRVTGRHRDFSADERRLNKSELASRISRLMQSRDARISARALAAAAALKIKVADKALVSLIRSENASDTRLQAFNALVAQNSGLLDQLTPELLTDVDPILRIRALELSAERSPATIVSYIRKALQTSRDLNERQNAIRLLADVGTDASDETIVELLQQASEPKNNSVRLEIIEAAKKRADENPAIQELLTDFDTNRQAASESDVTAAFSECFEGGSRRRGETLFRTHLAAQCIRCHRVGKEGSNVGPPLDDVATRRDLKHILRAIIAPSADIDQKYRSQIVVLSSGKTVQGLLVKKNKDSMTLADTKGKQIEIQLDDVEESIEQKTSIMPDMKKVLTRRDIRDLMAYLLTLTKKSSKSSGRP